MQISDMTRQGKGNDQMSGKHEIVSRRNGRRDFVSGTKRQ
jgi:hypothetical protein